MTEVKPATDSVLIEARNVRVEEWPCDCPTFDEEGAHLYLCPVILIPALLARIESDRARDATERELRAVVEVSLTNLRRFAESPITPRYDAPMSGNAIVVRDILAAAFGREIALTQANDEKDAEIARLKREAGVGGGGMKESALRAVPRACDLGKPLGDRWTVVQRIDNGLVIGLIGPDKNGQVTFVPDGCTFLLSAGALREIADLIDTHGLELAS